MILVSTKREDREFCLQFLYHFQLPVFQEQKKDIAPEEIFERVHEFRQTLGVELPTESIAYVSTMVKGILKHHEELRNSR